MSKPSNSKQIIGMSIGAIIGGVIGGVCGFFLQNPSPGILIPIGVVIGLAVSMPMVNKKSS